MTELSSPTRSGRAGRVRPGECWSLVTRKTAENMAPFPTPEIERVSIDQLYLRIESSLDGFAVRAPHNIWTVIQHDGPDHLGLWCNAAP